MLTTEDPETSMAVEYHQADRRTKSERNYAMGRVTATTFGPDQYALNVPVPKRVEIAPGAALRFTTDPNQRLFLQPGAYDAFITIEDKGRSNTITFSVAFTRESVAPLLALARDPKEEYGRREWADQWLAKLYPQFRLQLPLPDASEATRKRMEGDNQAVLDGFASWWRAHAQSAEVDAILRRVNG